MGFRFRNTFTLLPGVKINLSRTGLSTTLGLPGGSVNIGKRGTFLNTSIPGTGISHRQELSGAESNSSVEQELQTEKPPFKWFSKGVVVLVLIGWWWYWGYTKEPQPGNSPMTLKQLLIGEGVLLGLAILWQLLRYKIQRDEEKANPYGTPSPSFWVRIFSPKQATHVGQRGGQYYVNSKGNKVYKKKGR